MIRNEIMAAPNPTAMLVIAMVCIAEEKPSRCSRVILFDMKYGRFRDYELILGYIFRQNKKK